ncbi:hypothetical protein C1H46_035028, partial [Malus baccata]
VPALRGKDYGKSKMSYPDYTETESGRQYKDLRVGDGPKPKVGETVVVSHSFSERTLSSFHMLIGLFRIEPILLDKFVCRAMSMCNVLHGRRALDFVLRNQGLIDKTLLFDIELIKIIPN